MLVNYNVPGFLNLLLTLGLLTVGLEETKKVTSA